MHSGELARLAGVTVRALRHYHQRGLLPEPRRRANGYREYDVHHLVRVLRIRRLASIGVPLDRMPQLLDEAAAPCGDADGDAAVLEEIDAELAAQIERLTRQRAVIATLREHRAALDAPPELAPFLSVLRSARLPAELIEMDRDQSVLLAHLAGESGLPWLSSVYSRLSDDAHAQAIAELTGRFARLDAETPAGEVAELIERFSFLLGEALAGLADTEGGLELGAAGELVDAYVRDRLNPAQRQMLAELRRRTTEQADDGA